MNADLSWFRGKFVQKAGGGGTPAHAVEIVAAFLSPMGTVKLVTRNPAGNAVHLIDAEGATVTDTAASK
jgi:hypothetical protein